MRTTQQIIDALKKRYMQWMEDAHSRDNNSALEPSFPVPQEPSKTKRYLKTPEQLDRLIAYYEDRGAMPHELFFVPESWLYDKILDQLTEDDVVVDMGAGDLRLSLLMAEKVQKVYAVEINHEIISYALDEIGYDLPINLDVIVANMMEYEIPSDVTTIVLLVKNVTRDLPDDWGNYRVLRASPDGESVIGKLSYDKILHKLRDYT